jgi:hypothetical protein
MGQLRILVGRQQLTVGEKENESLHTTGIAVVEIDLSKLSRLGWYLDDEQVPATSTRAVKIHLEVLWRTLRCRVDQK